ncbi:MAG: formylglycine-generating enzyme family protein [Bacteroidales bacterium]|nr:formylglycine-generating enzyme family protein [Bacteroidales bacterium]
MSLAFGFQSCKKDKDDSPATSTENTTGNGGQNNQNGGGNSEDNNNDKTDPVPPTFNFSEKLNSENKTIENGAELTLTIGNLTAESVVSAFLDGEPIEVKDGVITLPTTSAGEHKVKVVVNNEEKEFTFKVLLPALEIKTCALSSEETEFELNSELKLNLETNNLCAITVKVNGNTIEAKNDVYYLPTDEAGEFDVSVEFNDGQNEAQIKNLEYTVVLPKELSFTVSNVTFKMKLVSGYTGGDFYMAETETTQALWQAVMGKNPSWVDDGYYQGGVGNDLPVNMVSWNDIRIDENDNKCFLTKLNAATGKSFRLPSSAEWEYAAKGGDLDAVYSGCRAQDSLQYVAWYWDNIDGVYGCREVATKKPNGYGLYDMSGNLWEWCEDEKYGSERVYRGGSWLNDASDCKVSIVSSDGPDDWSGNLGFRLALSPQFKK